MKDRSIQTHLRSQETWHGRLGHIQGGLSIVWTYGNQKLLDHIHATAVVGPRVHSARAQELTTRLVDDLVRRNHVIISGGARGVDIMAHEAALSRGGQTIIIPGEPLNPKRPIHQRWHRILSQASSDNWLILYVHPPWVYHSKRLFISRNKYVVAMSDQCVIVEGRRKSGTAHTADIAFKNQVPIKCLSRDFDEDCGALPNWLLSQHQAMPYQFIGEAQENSTEMTRLYESEIAQLLMTTSGQMDIETLMTRVGDKHSLFEMLWEGESRGEIRRIGSMCYLCS